MIAKARHAQEWIEAMENSPDGMKLAVGSHDNTIYVYETFEYDLIAKIEGHKSFIVSIDWSMDSKYIRSVCGGHELLFFKVSQDGASHDPSGA